jgi:hypothetical protein
VNAQLEFLQPFLQLDLKPIRIATVLEADDEVIGISEDERLAASFDLPEVIKPQIQLITQADVSQQGRNDCPLVCSFRKMPISKCAPSDRAGAVDGGKAKTLLFCGSSLNCLFPLCTPTEPNPRSSNVFFSARRPVQLAFKLISEYKLT